MNPRNKKVCIICTLDRFANTVRPKKIKEFLEKNGYIVELINTYPNKVKSKSPIPIFAASYMQSLTSLRRRIPHPPKVMDCQEFLDMTLA